MKRIIFLLIICYFSILVSYSETIDTVRVVNCVDGDTIDVEFSNKSQKRVRILGVDAYDSRSNRMINGQSKRSNYLLSRSDVIIRGKQATKMCKNILEGNNVILKYHKNKYKDRYDRILAFIYYYNNDILYNWTEFLLNNKLGNAYCKDKEIQNFEYYNNISEFRCK